MATANMSLATNAAGATDWDTDNEANLLLVDAHDHTTGKGVTVVGSVPVGGIIIWSGSVASIPTHWQICDGTNGTPDLRDKFVMGAGSTYAVNATGGAATASLAHTHTNPTTSAGSSHTHTNPVTGDQNLDHTHAPGAITVNAEAAHTHTVFGATTTQTGSTVKYDGPGASQVTDTGHYHNVNVASAAGSSHTHTASGAATAGMSGPHGHPQADTGAEASHTHTQAASGSGGSATQAILNPYLALAYIQRLT